MTLHLQFLHPTIPDQILQIITTTNHKRYNLLSLSELHHFRSKDWK